MIQLFLVLCGSRLIREKWWMFFSLGALWMLIGGFVFVDALDGALVIPVAYFAIPLAFDGAAIKISQALVLFAISFYNKGREKGLTGTRYASQPAGLGQIPASKDEAVGNAGESVVP